jgi:hypothetical protein
MEDARRRRFDVLLVWKLDRLSRSLRDLLNTLDHLSTWAWIFSRAQTETSAQRIGFDPECRGHPNVERHLGFASAGKLGKGENRHSG